MMTEQDATYHDVYNDLSAERQQIVKSAFYGAIEQFRADGINCPMDDRAEQLIAALTRYIIGR